ncbi:MAG TPA: histidinol dehydrogenase [Frankiaceae bacterium]|jgi:histidinol dehydrogenase|nr:histidinol dehydrogenase [Frankiaceae bacterium]
MLRRVDLRGAPLDRAAASSLPRAATDVDAALDAVRPIVADVRERGADAAREWTDKLDGVVLSDLRVPAPALAAALDALDPRLRAALEESARRARLVHEAQRRHDVTVSPAPGLTVTERYVPVRRVGLYVPGGRVAYPSSVVMNAVPAQVAGVASLAVASPPKLPDGLPHPSVLAACALLGIEEVYAVGGAQAIALLAYGSDGIEPVDIVTGPGNVYVAAAKRLVRGVVGIDAEAGPTEIAILADDTASAAYVAADLRAQAEHDPMAACLLVTTSVRLADEVDALLPHGLVDAAATVLVATIEEGLAVVDAWAPEHLEVVARDATSVAARVRNAGAVFVGDYAPVSLGDYLAGSNHVLPTAGTARHTGGLSVDAFVRGVHVVEATREALADVAEHVDALGGAEELPCHVAAVRERLT